LKRPSGSSLKLLDVIQRKGVESIALMLIARSCYANAVSHSDRLCRNRTDPWFRSPSQRTLTP
jgi:hypothetical protein